MTSEIDKTPNTFWKEKEAIMSTHNISPIKSVKRLKSPKKNQESKKSANEVKIEDVFLNAEYFKCQSGNISSLSFCSGDNGENQWTVDSKLEVPLRRKSAKLATYPNDTIKSDTAVMEKEKISKHWEEKLKKPKCPTKENPQENTGKFLEGILTGQERFDRDLITLITDQMFLAERELQITRTHLMETISKLNERELEIIQLHEKIQNLQKSKKTDKTGYEGSNKTSEDYQRLVKASEKLKKQVKDMEEFLNEYGLVWVGDKSTNQRPDFDKIIKSFHRLNSVASQPKIIQTIVGAKFELPREIPLVLYSNGLLLRDTDFREYNKTSTSLFLQDVEDGYFPGELQAEFPEGVPFEVIDKRNEVYNPHAKTPTFQGQGHRLGSSFEGKPSPLVYLEPQKQNRIHDPHLTSRQDFADKYSLKNIYKKKSKNIFLQNEKIPSNLQINGTNHRVSTEIPRKETANAKNPLNVKIRFGKEKTESFLLRVKENEKMYAFQMELQRQLCQRYHDECIVNSESNNGFTDFEFHIYGRNPIRLSDHLNEYPKECGIENNCLINVTEI